MPYHVGYDYKIDSPNRVLGGAGPSTLLNGLLYAWNLDTNSKNQTDVIQGKTMVPADAQDKTTVNGPLGIGDPALDFSVRNVYMQYPSYDLTDIMPTTDSSFTVSICLKDPTPAIFTWIRGGPPSFFTAFEHTLGGPNYRVLGQDNSSNSYFKDVAATLTGWHSYIGWRDSSTDTINIQIDGGIVNSDAFPVNQTFPIGVFIGYPTYDGAMSRFYVWNRVLTSGERTNIAAYAKYPFL